MLTRFKTFNEGLRVRHWGDSNSVKAYNEQNNFRIETTINDPTKLKVHRSTFGDSFRLPAENPKVLDPTCSAKAEGPELQKQEYLLHYHHERNHQSEDIGELVILESPSSPIGTIPR